MDEAREMFCSCVAFDEIVEETESGKTRFSVFLRDPFRAEELITKMRDAALEPEIEELARSDWVHIWKQHIRPFRFTDTFEVVPAWSGDEAGERKILIDTDVTFGLGDHPTTRMLGRIVEENIRKGDTFLDVGCGTGLLCVLAHKCGAAAITGVDISEEAVRITERNCYLNRLTRARVILGDAKDLKKDELYDFVAANLDTVTLLSCAEQLRGLIKDQGLLAVSGISKERASCFREGFSTKGLRMVSEQERAGWCAYLFAKKAGFQKRT